MKNQKYHFIMFFYNDFRRSIQPKLFGAAVFKARRPFTDQRLTARHRQESSRAEWHSCNGLQSTVTDHVSSRTCLGYAKTADMLAWKHPRNLIELHEVLLEEMDDIPQMSASMGRIRPDSRLLQSNTLNTINVVKNILTMFCLAS